MEMKIKELKGKLEVELKDTSPSKCSQENNDQ